MNYDSKLDSDWQEQHIEKLESQLDELQTIQNMILSILDSDLNSHDKLLIIRALLDK